MNGEDDNPQGGLSLPSDFDDLARKFAIDQEIRLLADPKPRGVHLASRWADFGLDAAISFGRRSLEVGFYAASGPHPETQKPDWIEEWKAGASAATAARDAMRGLLLFLAPRDIAMSNPDHLLVPLRSMIREDNPSLSPAEVVIKAREKADTLQGAWAILSAVSLHMERHRSEVAGSTQNPGNPAKREFIAYIARSWVFLTGRVPGKNPNLDQNPFMRFANAAWADLGGMPTSFERAIRILDGERLMAEEWKGRAPPF